MDASHTPSRQDVLLSQDAVAHIEAFRQRRAALVRPSDKRSTVFASPADLVWGWIADPEGFRRFASELGFSEQELAEMVESWEFQDPPFVRLIEENKAK